MQFLKLSPKPTTMEISLQSLGTATAIQSSCSLQLMVTPFLSLILV